MFATITQILNSLTDSFTQVIYRNSSFRITYYI